MFVHAVTGSVSLSRDKHMQHGGMRLAFHFSLKAACATNLSVHVCLCMHVCVRMKPHGVGFPYQLTTMSLSFHPPSHQVSLAVNCEDKSSHAPARLRKWCCVAKSTHG